MPPSKRGTSSLARSISQDALGWIVLRRHGHNGDKRRIRRKRLIQHGPPFSSQSTEEDPICFPNRVSIWPLLPARPLANSTHACVRGSRSGDRSFGNSGSKGIMAWDVKSNIECRRRTQNPVRTENARAMEGQVYAVVGWLRVPPYVIGYLHSTKCLWQRLRHSVMWEQSML